MRASPHFRPLSPIGAAFSAQVPNAPEAARIPIKGLGPRGRGRSFRRAASSARSVLDGLCRRTRLVSSLSLGYSDLAPVGESATTARSALASRTSPATVPGRQDVPLHLLLGYILLFGVGCIRKQLDSDAGPAMSVLDSTVLAEPDSLEAFLALRTQARAAHGGLLLDTGEAIVQFDSQGTVVRVLGRPGHGPGEFVRISSIGLLAGDSLVAAVDARRARIVVFGLNNGNLRREVPLRAPFYPDQQWLTRGDTVIMPGKLLRAPFTSWVTTTDSVWSWGVAPPIYARSQQAYSQGGEPSIAPYGDGWIGLFPADPDLYVLDRAGRPQARVTIPVRRRLGVPPNVAEQVAAIAASGSFRFAASLVLAVRRLNSGAYLLMHVDADARLVRSVNDPSSGRGGVAYEKVRYWASMLSPDLRRACVDGLAPIEVDNILSPFFSGDTLFFVARRVMANDRVRAVLYSIALDDSRCAWTPTEFTRIRGNDR